MAPAASSADVLLVGGGLANSLIALALKAARPDLRIAMLERESGRDDSHTWSAFATDLSAASGRRLLPLAAARWEGYAIRFPQHARSFSTPYVSFTGDRLGEAVEGALGENLHRGAQAAQIAPDHVTLADGRRFEAPLVIDGRGARPSSHLSLAWQKFVGLEVRTAQPHGVARPVMMDATVPQRDGYRFLYVLPLSADTLLVEDTRYSDGPALDVADLAAQVRAYAAGQGWTIAEVIRREQGVLPLALGGDIDAFLDEAPAGLPVSGMRAALFHPTTGYSLPDAAGLAEEIGAAPDLTSAAVDRLVRARSRRLWRERGFYRALNRMMFLAAEPQDRYRVLQRFYRLPQPLVERFYAGRSTLADRLRVLTGVPPVPITRALKALPPSAAFRGAFKGDAAHA